MDIVSGAVIGIVGWVGVLAKNYYTQMAEVAIERSKREQLNEQERVQREREQFDIVFQNLLTRVNEEREIIQSLIAELKNVIERSAEIDKEVLLELNQIRRERNAFLPTVWNGEER
jgi:hypothetical protein